MHGQRKIGQIQLFGNQQAMLPPLAEQIWPHAPTFSQQRGAVNALVGHAWHIPRATNAAYALGAMRPLSRAFAPSTTPSAGTWSRPEALTTMGPQRTWSLRGWWLASLPARRITRLPATARQPRYICRPLARLQILVRSS